jgi:hypothetical protein
MTHAAQFEGTEPKEHIYAHPGISVLDATVWDLCTFGQHLIGCSPDDGKIHAWQNDTGAAAAVLSNAPVNCSGVVVTPELIMALGAGGNNRKHQWSDLEEENVWTPSTPNQAGDGEVPTGRLMCGRVVGHATLLLTDVDAPPSRICRPAVHLCAAQGGRQLRDHREGCDCGRRRDDCVVEPIRFLDL